ncbi:MAG: GNAT family N-acetyltransferase [Candidatus Aenigmarchaeota archaeon]|nr:GNAT family N-acetyltransferase [Candidatus Aenigmarchaeota archaeon]
MRIRKATETDVSACLQIQKQDHETYWLENDFIAALRNIDVIFLVAEENSKIIGYVIGYLAPTKRTDCLLSETRVNIHHRKKGIGTKLVNAFVTEAFKKGASVIYAEIEEKHLPFYHDACKFSKSHDWIEVVMRKKTSKNICDEYKKLIG